MKLSITALAGVLALASAQSLDGMPPCAQGCVGKSVPKECGIDIECICTSTSFIDSITCCIADKCSSDEQKEVIKFANDICGTAGVTNLPQSAICSTESQSATETSNSSAQTGSTSGTASSTVSNAASATDEATSTGTGSTTGSDTMSPTGTSTSPSATESGSSDDDDEDDTTATQTGSGAEATESGNTAFSLTANGGLLAAFGALVMAIA